MQNTKKCKPKKCKTSSWDEQRARVLFYKSQVYSDTQIAKKTGVNPSSISRMIRTLHSKGYLCDDKVTGKGVQFMEKMLVLSKNDKIIRLHDLTVKIDISLKCRAWENKRQNIVNIKQVKGFKQWKIKNNIQQQFYIEDTQIRTTSKSIFIRLTDIEAKSAFECKHRAIDTINALIPKIENLFGITLDIHKPILTIPREHDASVFNEIAEFFLKRGFSLQIKDSRGRLRLITDYSKGRPELEAVNANFAEQDIDRVDSFLLDLIEKDPPNLSDIHKKQKELENMFVSIEQLFTPPEPHDTPDYIS